MTLMFARNARVITYGIQGVHQGIGYLIKSVVNVTPS